MIEAREGTIAFTTPVPQSINPPTAAPFGTRAAPGVTTSAPTSPIATTGGPVTLNPTDPTGATATLIPTTAPQPTRTPLPTANLTLPPTLTPRFTTPPTSTPSPSPTGTRQAVCSSASQQTLTPGWNISKVCLHQADNQFWVVFGEATNNTGGSVSFVEVIVTFRNSSGATIGQDFNEITVDTMPNGISLPFSIPVDSFDPPAQIVFEVSAAPGTLTPRSDFTWTAQLTGSGNDLRLTGQVTNPGAALTDYAELNARFYNQAGQVVATGYTFLNADDLGASQSVGFEVDVIGLPEHVVTYSIVVLGF